ncbi:MAG: enoyl-CoA hydratase-related protein [Nitrososphaeria archaeon]
MSSVAVSVEPPIAVLTLSRPERLNAINPRMVAELSSELDSLEEKEEVRAIIITGAGKAFSAGADINELRGMSPIGAAIFSRRFQELTLKIEWLPKPVIAAINGYALGGGLELAMACDLRIASETAEVGQPEINIGIIPGAGGTQRLPRLTGRGRAKAMIFTGDRVKARDALAVGLVDAVVPPESLMDEARKLALKLAEKPPLALMAAKYAIQVGMESNIWAGLSSEAWLFGLLTATQDFTEGVNAFLAKRKANFRGS